MAFLRPNALWALPLVLIPLVIHLIHRRHFQTVPWAAMTFLLVASSSDLGRRKLNRCLLLLVRMLAIAAIVIAMARPVRLQGAGIFDWVMRPFASSSTLVVLLDRSPSMRGSVGGEKILQAATTRLDQLRSQLQPARTIVFDSVRESPIIIAEGREVSQLSNSGPVDSQTDVPGLMARAVDWLRNQDVRDAEIFLCSDLQQSDWRVESAQWSSLRAELEEATRDESLQWRFHTTVPGNDSLPNDWIRATQIAPARPNESVRVLIEVGSNQQVSHTVKASLIAGGNIEEFDITVGRGTGQIERLIDIPNENSNATAESVSVTFSIPPDGNLADNQFHLVLNADRPSIGLVAQEDGDALAAAIEVIGRLVWNTDQTIPQRVNEEGLVGIVWQGQLPVGDEAMKLSEFTQNGGSVLLLPPVGDYSTNEFQGVRWGKWQKGRAVQVADDLEINATSICPPIISNESEEKRAVATAMRQVTLGEGRLLFLGIDATSMNSRFVSDGAAMLQLVDNVVAASGKVIDSDFEAGRVVAPLLESQNGMVVRMEDRLNASTDVDQVALMTEAGHHAGVYRIGEASSGRLIAVNRPASEDSRSRVSLQTITQLSGVDWNRLDLSDAGGLSNSQPWLRHWWTLAWLALISLLLVEGWLSLPVGPREAHA